MTYEPQPSGGIQHAAGTEKFQYRAVDRRGKIQHGFVAAPSLQSALEELDRMSLMPIEIGSALASGARIPKFSRTPRAEDITGATRDLAMLLKGGMNLDRALLVIADTGDFPSVSALMRSVNAGVTAGKSLAESLSAHGKAFPTHYVKMVEVAEAKGKLAETLTLIVHERARSEALRRRIASALTYPVFLFVAATAVLIFVLTYVVPEFERAFAGFPQQAAGQTELIFALSRTLRGNAPLLAAAVIAGLVGLLVANRSRSARSVFFQLLAKIPGLRRAFLYEQTTVLCATLSALLSSGVDISSALRLVRDLMRDRRAADRLDGAIMRVRQGERISDVLREATVLPAYATHMLRIGEQSGEISASLARISMAYEEKLDRALGRVTAILGPAVLLFVSAMIAWIIISVMTALLSMNDLLLAWGYMNAYPGFA